MHDLCGSNLVHVVFFTFFKVFFFKVFFILFFLKFFLEDFNFSIPRSSNYLQKFDQPLTLVRSLRAKMRCSTVNEVFDYQ